MNDTPCDYTAEEMAAIFGYLTEDDPPPDGQLVQVCVIARHHPRGGWSLQVGAQEWALPDFAGRFWRPTWATTERGVEMRRLARSLGGAREAGVKSPDEFGATP